MASSEIDSPQQSTDPQPVPATTDASMSAVVIGGTGAVGRCLVGVLLREKMKFGKVTVVGRRKVDSVDESYGINIQDEESSGRLVQVEQDMDEADDEFIQRLCTGVNVFFCCLGTTRRAAGSAERFHHIDHDIPLKFAKAAKSVGVSHYSVVTSWGSKASSMFLYTRTKGELEDAVINLKFNFTTILRPGLLDRGGEKRFVEKFFGVFMKAMPVSTIAEAMAVDAYTKHTQTTPSEEAVVTIVDNSGIYATIAAKGESKETAATGSSVDPPTTSEATAAGQSSNDEETGEQKDQSEPVDAPVEQVTESGGSTVEENTEEDQKQSEEIADKETAEEKKDEPPAEEKTQSEEQTPSGAEENTTTTTEQSTEKEDAEEQ